MFGWLCLGKKCDLSFPFLVINLGENGGHFLHLDSEKMVQFSLVSLASKMGIFSFSSISMGNSLFLELFCVFSGLIFYILSILLNFEGKALC